MITVYSTRNCAYCPMVKRYLKAKNVTYKEIDVTDNLDVRGELQDKTGYTTVPVTTDGTTYVVGWKPGELSELIGGK